MRICRLRLPYILSLILVLGTLITGVVYNQSKSGAQRLFAEGNILYQQEDFAAAVEKYHQIEEMGLVSAPLYFNLGNCYYRLEKIGRAILYYERALRLDPKDEDTLANLAIANQATVDRITPPPEFALATWVRWALYLLPVSTLLRILAVIYLLLAGFATTLILTRSRRLHFTIKRLAFVALVLLFVTTSLFLAQWRDSRNRVEAIVLAEELPALDAPSPRAKEVFSIHEGTKVRIGQASNGWVEIILIDGKIGWVSSDRIEKI